MLRFSFLTVPLLALCAAPALAQEETAPDAPLSWSGYDLINAGRAGQVSVDQVDGDEVLTVTRTTVMLDGAEFSEGVIEFDLAFDEARGFGGLLWHAQDDGSQEYFYIRQHKSGEPDAGQYTPVRNGLTSWQIYTDRNGIGPFSYTHEGWNRFKMVVADDKADIYLNGSPHPILHVPDLAADNGTGGIGFRATGPNGEIRIANLVMRPLVAGEAIVGRPAGDRTSPDGTIEVWSVSEKFAEAMIDGQDELPAALARLNSHGLLRVEPFGIADISRVAGPEQGGDTVLVSTRIVSDAARPVRLQFGYSDRLRLFLNGELVFDGSAGFRSRDFFFLGTIGFNDAVVMNLRQGENVLTAAVSETFGGWGFAGVIADREGLRIAP